MNNFLHSDVAFGQQVSGIFLMSIVISLLPNEYHGCTQRRQRPKTVKHVCASSVYKDITTPLESQHPKMNTGNTSHPSFAKPLGDIASCLQIYQNSFSRLS